MRLICPNCGAQYEVDDAVIPEAGRDVQCSACGRLWFQKSHSMLEAEGGELREPLAAPEGWDIPGADTPGNTALPEPAGAAEPAAALPETMPEAEDPDDAALARALAGIPAEAAPAEEAAEDAAAATEPEPEGPEPEPAAVPAPAPAPAAAAPPQRRTLDDSLLAILREEAEREARARRAEGATPLETQEEMNLEPPPAAAASRAAAKLAGIAAAPTAQQVPDFSDLSVPDAAETEAETRAETDEERFADLNEREDAAPGGAPRGRGRLPDIEQINSTLRASADRAGEAAAHDTPQVLARQRSGFRLGFTLVMGLAAVLAVLYGFAPRLGAAAPPLAPALGAYVGAVNDGRIWLDGQLRGVIETLQPHTKG
ncbi:zinc-ribbon domain-containing protein [Paenirhodobacter huangdaonensis]|nr:zinc-ribbon domain-containing protein [Sinirhodobacter huangdaonensis]